MSLAPQAEECQQTVDDEIALDSTCLLRKVVHLCLVHDFAQEEGAIERDFIINSLLALFCLRRR